MAFQQVERDRDRERERERDRERKSSTVSDDIWANEKDQWLTSAQKRPNPNNNSNSNSDAWSTTRDPLSPPKSMSTHAPENDYMSDVASNGGGRMYRSVSGQSLGDMDQYHQQQQQIMMQQQQQQQEQNGNQRQV